MIALVLLILIAVSFFSYKLTISNQHLLKEVNYHKAIKDLGNPIFASYFLITVFSFIFLAILINYQRNIFQIDLGLVLISIVSLFNVLISYKLYISYIRFKCGYQLFSINLSGKRYPLK